MKAAETSEVQSPVREARGCLWHPVFCHAKAPGKKALQLPVPPGDLGSVCMGCSNRAVAVPTGMFVGLLSGVSPFNF